MQWYQPVMTKADTMRMIYHPKFILLFPEIESETRLWILLVMKHVEGQQFYKYIWNSGNLVEGKGKEIIRQIIAALRYCDGHNTVRRELQTRSNTFLDKNGKVKISKFVLSTQIEPVQMLNWHCAPLFWLPITLGRHYVWWSKECHMDFRSKYIIYHCSNGSICHKRAEKRGCRMYVACPVWSVRRAGGPAWPLNDSQPQI